VTGGGTGVHHGDFAAHPCTHLLDGAARSVVGGLRLLEVVEDMLRAVGCPEGKQVVISVLQRAAATDGDQPGIRDRAENHRSLPFGV